MILKLRSLFTLKTAKPGSNLTATPTTAHVGQATANATPTTCTWVVSAVLPVTSSKNSLKEKLLRASEMASTAPEQTVMIYLKDIKPG